MDVVWCARCVGLCVASFELCVFLGEYGYSSSPVSPIGIIKAESTRCGCPWHDGAAVTLIRSVSPDTCPTTETEPHVCGSSSTKVSKTENHSEIGLAALRRAERNGLSLRFHDKGVTLVLDCPGDGAGLCPNGESRFIATPVRVGRLALIDVRRSRSSSLAVRLYTLCLPDPNSIRKG